MSTFFSVTRHTRILVKLLFSDHDTMCLNSKYKMFFRGAARRRQKESQPGGGGGRFPLRDAAARLERIVPRDSAASRTSRIIIARTREPREEAIAAILPSSARRVPFVDSRREQKVDSSRTHVP